MPRCCITKYLLESLDSGLPPKGYTHYYDEEIREFTLEYRGVGKGTWYFRYRAVDGKIKFLRMGALGKVDLSSARARAYALHKMLEEGVDPAGEHLMPVGQISMEQFVVEHYLPQARLRKRSWELDQRILRLHILPTLGARHLGGIKRMDIVSWQSGLKSKGLASGTCNRAFALLKTIFNCAMRWGVLQGDQNPCRNVSLFEDPGFRERYLTPGEARLLLDELDKYQHKGALAIQLLLFTGARKNEILSARWENVDLERRLLTVPLSKSGKVRHIPLSDEAVKIFQKIPREINCPWVFPGSVEGSHIRSVFTLWDHLRVRLGLHDVRLHDLRHSFASFLVNSGCSLYEVQKCLGHYDPRVTMRYAHLATQSLVKAANMVGKSVTQG